VAESVKQYLARIGRKGGKASRRRLTAEQRVEAARKAAEARWAKQRKLVDEITKGTKELLRVAQKRERALKKKHHV
jgi:hypothetical protein